MAALFDILRMVCYVMVCISLSVLCLSVSVYYYNRWDNKPMVMTLDGKKFTKEFLEDLKNGHHNLSFKKEDSQS